jgi:uncharacterized membrane protein/protein-disulfide isomerase
MQPEKNLDHLPFPVYFWTIALLSALGIVVSIYLAISHFRVYTDIGYSSFCALSQAINCDTVSQSSYAVQFGLPVSVLGVLAYLFFLIVLFHARLKAGQPQRMWSLLFLLALMFSIYSVYLALVSTYHIHSYCIMCVVDYGINLALLFFTWLTGRRFRQGGILPGLFDDLRFLKHRWQTTLPILAGFFLITAALLAFYPNYWTIKPLQNSEAIKEGLTEDGHPWIGASEPKVIITEFSDYQCFQCNKIHYYLRQLVTQYPDKLRLVHRHFPMDHRFNPLVKEPYHLRAGPFALAAIYAAEEGVFWKANDYFFQIARMKENISAEKIAEVIGLDKDELEVALNRREIRLQLSRDIREGIQLGFTGTPGFVVNGETFQATLPIEKLLEQIN